MNVHSILRRARRRGYLLYSRSEARRIPCQTRAEIFARWIRDHRRQCTIAVIVDEWPAEEYRHLFDASERGWHVELFFPVDDADAGYKSHFGLDDGKEFCVDNLADVVELVSKIAATPSSIDEVRKLAAVIEVHEL